MPEIPFYTTIADESTEISEDLSVRRSRAEQIMQRGWQRLGSIEEIHSTLDAMTAPYMRDFDISSVRGLRAISKIESNLKVLAKKEKEINATKME
jgi:hypothetical protein